MAWGDPTYLKFDVDAISSMRKKLQETAKELTDYKVTLIKEVEALKANWRTTAGKKFTQNIDTDWSSQVDKYVKVINAVDELLAVAESDYKAVADKAKTVSF